MNFEKDYNEISVRRFKDMRDRFKDSDYKRNPIIYKVYKKDFGTFMTGLTVIESGTINKEYFMTKGHRHKRGREEIYILLEGKGKLFLQNRKSKIINMKKNKFYLVPKGYGHRLINTGNTKLKVLTIYSKNVVPDYTFGFKKRFFKK